MRQEKVEDRLGVIKDTKKKKKKKTKRNNEHATKGAKRKHRILRT